MTNPDFSSVYAKLGRAEEHFKLLDAEIDTWIKCGHDTFTVERGEYDTRLGLAVHFHEPKPDFIRWTLMAADCIYNLRCVLDHLIYAVGKHETRENPTSDVDKNQFVIADRPTDFWVESKGKLKGLSCTLLNVIESVQPYNRTHPILASPLKILRRINNADKHRLLQMAGAGVAGASVEFLGDTNRGSKSVYLFPKPIQDNDIVCAVVSSESDPNLAFQGVRISIEVALWYQLSDGDPTLTHTGYSVLLPLLIREVRFVIEQMKVACL